MHFNLKKGVNKSCSFGLLGVECTFFKVMGLKVFQLKATGLNCSFCKSYETSRGLHPFIKSSCFYIGNHYEYPTIGCFLLKKLETKRMGDQGVPNISWLQTIDSNMTLHTCGSRIIAPQLWRVSVNAIPMVDASSLLPHMNTTVG